MAPSSCPVERSGKMNDKIIMPTTESFIDLISEVFYLETYDVPMGQSPFVFASKTWVFTGMFIAAWG